MTLEVIPPRVRIRTARLDLGAALLGTLPVAVPLSVHPQLPCVPGDGVVPQKGIGDDSVLEPALDPRAGEVGHEDHLVVPVLVEGALLVDDDLEVHGQVDHLLVEDLDARVEEELLALGERDGL